MCNWLSFYCILDIKVWLLQNLCKLNQDKKEALVIVSKPQREKLASKLHERDVNQAKKLEILEWSLTQTFII